MFKDLNEELLKNLGFPGYQSNFVHSNIDIAKLRPDKSYEFLFDNRDYALKAILDENNGDIPNHFLESVACSLCGNDASSPVLIKDGFKLVECLSCQLVYVNPRLSPQAYLETYNSVNYGHIISKLALESHEYRKNRFGIERIEKVEEYYNSKLEKTLLDIGSASGFFLEAASQRGWNVIGLELTDSAVEFSRARGNDVRKQTLEESNFSKESFSVITLFDVLEHLSDPIETLRNIWSLLKPGGLVYIYVPNWNSAARLLSGQNAHFIWPTHHLTYFTPSTISKAFKVAGFEIELVETQGLDIVDWLWQEKKLHGKDTTFVENKAEELQFLANAGGYGKNLRIMGRKLT